MSAHWPSDDDLPPLDVVVPDDARDLDADVRAYHRELRRRGLGGAGAGHGPPNGPPKRRWSGGRRWTLPTGIVVCLGLVAALLSLFGPRAARTGPPGTLPVAGEPTGAPGQVGGTLPDTTLTVAGERVPVARMRPAVLALVPPQCRCTALVKDVSRQAVSLDVPVYLVQRPFGPTDPQRLSERVTRRGPGQVRSATDHTGVLTATYLDRAPTFVLVHADGIVREVLSGVRATDPLGPHLTPLRGPGARW